MRYVLTSDQGTIRIAASIEQFSLDLDDWCLLFHQSQDLTTLRARMKTDIENDDQPDPKAIEFGMLLWDQITTLGGFPKLVKDKTARTKLLNWFESQISEVIETQAKEQARQEQANEKRRENIIASFDELGVPSGPEDDIISTALILQGTKPKELKVEREEIKAEIESMITAGLIAPTRRIGLVLARREVGGPLSDEAKRLEISAKSFKRGT